MALGFARPKTNKIVRSNLRGKKCKLEIQMVRMTIFKKSVNSKC